jgi:hypothetical protein
MATYESRMGRALSQAPQALNLGTGGCAPHVQVRSRVDDGGAVRKLSIKSDLNEARKVMGYCPQFDGIQPNMTAREHLRFYAMIRGVPPASLEQTVDDLLMRMDLVQYADRQVWLLPLANLSTPPSSVCLTAICADNARG